MPCKCYFNPAFRKFSGCFIFQKHNNDWQLNVWQDAGRSLRSIMNKSHRKVLLKHRVDLTKDLEPNEVMQYLYQEDILTENDVELIKGGRTRKERAELFLDTIPRKGPKAFDAFISSLKRENGTKHLAELLHVKAPPASTVGK